jgi:hypothetical protein
MKSEAPIGQIRALFKPASRMAFGKQHRLEVAAVIGAMGPPVWSRQLSETLGIAENQVAADLRHLLEWGALEQFPAPHDRRKLYLPVPHPVWRYSRELLERAITQASPDNGSELIESYWRSILGDRVPAEIPSGER